MRRARLPIAFGLAAAVSACASEPKELGDVRTKFDRAAADASVNRRAGVELHDARNAVERAEATWRVDGNFDEAVHQAYLADRRIDIAWMAAERRAVEEELAAMPRQGAARLAQRQGAAASFRIGDRVRLDPERKGDLEALLQRLDASDQERGVVTLGDVLFGFDQAELLPAAADSIDRLAQFLVNHPERSVLVEGHTDDTGVLEYNFDLSRRRADHVKSRLVGDGVESERVLTVGYGPTYPVASNASAAGRAQNRRVELVFLTASDGGR